MLRQEEEEEEEELDDEEEEEGEDPYEYSLSAVIAECANLAEEQEHERLTAVASGSKKRKNIQKDAYFSDEDASD